MLDLDAKGLDQARQAYEDGFVEINGRRYDFTKMRHLQRREVFAYATSVGEQMAAHNFGFLSSPEFARVEKIMSGAILFNGHALDRLTTHWEDYPDDYLMLIVMAMGVMSYPFMRGAAGASPSPTDPEVTRISLNTPI